MKFQYIFLLIIVFLTYVQAKSCPIQITGSKWASTTGGNPGCYGLNVPGAYKVATPPGCCYQFFDDFGCKGKRLGVVHCGNSNFHPISPKSVTIW
ncbi:unnamed protein product [Rhizophagus irregularis]|uniref:Uncharacterized protein n=1 Tax=Rhizophagus irregularis TaxID=588596 RepID=A0A2N1MQ73_9GLOM|nr:hypothetical protein RhiirC2_757822 [Rhizophagus irregularis]CAB4380163.1 unnamed protein product [Rhizophagus irregularis]